MNTPANENLCFICRPCLAAVGSMCGACYDKKCARARALRGLTDYAVAAYVAIESATDAGRETIVATAHDRRVIGWLKARKLVTLRVVGASTYAKAA